MGDSSFYSSLEILAYLLNQVFGETEITAEGFNRDHHTDRMIVDGWIRITFPKTIDLNSRLKNTIRSMLDLIRESFADHPDFISCFGEANLDEAAGNLITHGSSSTCLYDTESVPYYEEWTTNEHNSTFKIKYSIALKCDYVDPEVNEYRIKDDLAALQVTHRLLPETTDFIFDFINTNPTYEFDLFCKGQDIYVSAYLARYGGVLAHVFDSTVISNIINFEK